MKQWYGDMKMMLIFCGSCSCCGNFTLFLMVFLLQYDERFEDLKLLGRPLLKNAIFLLQLCLGIVISCSRE